MYIQSHTIEYTRLGQCQYRALGCKVDLKVYIQSHAVEYTRLGQCQYRALGCKVDLKGNWVYVHVYV